MNPVIEFEMTHQSLRFAKLMSLLAATILFFSFAGCGGGTSDADDSNGTDTNGSNEVEEVDVAKLQNELRIAKAKAEKSEQEKLSLEKKIEDLEQQIKDLEEEVEKQGWRWKAILLGIALIIGLPIVFLIAKSSNAKPSQARKILDKCPNCDWKMRPNQEICANPDCRTRFS
jgi:hypothetical protein